MTRSPHGGRAQRTGTADGVGGRERSMVERARGLASPAEALALYREWARTYDSDIYQELKFTGTARIAELLAERLADRAAHIIDLGCGTGAAGAELQRLGFHRLDGLDLSPDMLAVASGRGIYGETIAADLLQPLAIADAAYDSAISAGTFTTGHVGAAALPEIVRIVKPQGLIACVIAAGFWETGGFPAMLAGLEARRRVAILRDSLEPIRHGGEPEGRFLVLRRA